MYTNKISIIVPCRNEECYIEDTIKNILHQDYQNIEVLIIDGASSDSTADIIKKYAIKNSKIRFFENPNRTVSYALNLGIRNSKGDIIVRMDAHCKYPSNYVSELVKNLLESNAANVGGVWITKPGNSTNKAHAIAEATSSIFGIGNAFYRLKSKFIRKVDTVPFGCFKREIFNQIGLFDEDLIRNQDDEFNGRLVKNGGKILLIPSIKIEYFARTTFLKTSKMFYQYGLFKPLVNKKLGKPATVRQFFPVGFLVMLIIFPFSYLISDSLFKVELFIIGFYFFLNLFFSVKIAISRKKIVLFFILPYVFLIIHLSYGLGYLKGVFRFLILNRVINNSQIQLSR